MLKCYLVVNVANDLTMAIHYSMCVIMLLVNIACQAAILLCRQKDIRLKQCHVAILLHRLPFFEHIGTLSSERCIFHVSKYEYNVFTL